MTSCAPTGTPLRVVAAEVDAQGEDAVLQGDIGVADDGEVHEVEAGLLDELDAKAAQAKGDRE